MVFSNVFHSIVATAGVVLCGIVFHSCGSSRAVSDVVTRDSTYNETRNNKIELYRDSVFHTFVSTKQTNPRKVVMVMTPAGGSIDLNTGTATGVTSAESYDYGDVSSVTSTDVGQKSFAHFSDSAGVAYTETEKEPVAPVGGDKRTKAARLFLWGFGIGISLALLWKYGGKYIVRIVRKWILKF